MKQHSSSGTGKVIFPILFGFFVMGFVDVVGIATNYVKVHFALSDKLANLLPMMVFLWFAVFSIPTGILMGKAGRRNTVILSLLITFAAMLIPFFFYQFTFILIAFALLGIGNTILQVSLNPMIAYIVSPDRRASILTFGQFIKAVSSFLGPVIAGTAVAVFGSWIWIFPIYALTSLLAALWLLITVSGKEERMETNTTFASTLQLLKDKYILLLFFGILCIVGIDVGLNTSIPKLLMEKTGMPVEKAGLGTSLYFAARTSGAFIGTILLTRCSSVRFLQYTILIAIVSFLSLLLAENIWLIYTMIVITGLMCANVFSILFSFALKHKEEQANEVSALMIMGVSGGALFTPVMGVISDQFGQISGMSVLLICILYILFVSLKSRKENS
ncbi:MAG: MFS transporter [Tannerella sp.]|jgi:fucose permease|nr:MFS transporter [Tannerella sp.]